MNFNLRFIRLLMLFVISINALANDESYFNEDERNAQSRYALSAGIGGASYGNRLGGFASLLRLNTSRVAGEILMVNGEPALRLNGRLDIIPVRISITETTRDQSRRVAFELIANGNFSLDTTELGSSTPFSSRQPNYFFVSAEVAASFTSHRARRSSDSGIRFRIPLVRVGAGATAGRNFPGPHAVEANGATFFADARVALDLICDVSSHEETCHSLYLNHRIRYTSDLTAGNGAGLLQNHLSLGYEHFTQSWGPGTESCHGSGSCGLGFFVELAGRREVQRAANGEVAQVLGGFLLGGVQF